MSMEPTSEPNVTEPIYREVRRLLDHYASDPDSVLVEMTIRPADADECYEAGALAFNDPRFEYLYIISSLVKTLDDEQDHDEWQMVSVSGRLVKAMADGVVTDHAEPEASQAQGIARARHRAGMSD